MFLHFFALYVIINKTNFAYFARMITMSKIIAVANQKGGVGKTTTCINLSSFVAAMGKKTLMVAFHLKRFQNIPQSAELDDVVYGATAIGVEVGLYGAKQGGAAVGGVSFFALPFYGFWIYTCGGSGA